MPIKRDGSDKDEPIAAPESDDTGRLGTLGAVMLEAASKESEDALVAKVVSAAEELRNETVLVDPQPEVSYPSEPARPSTTVPATYPSRPSMTVPPRRAPNNTAPVAPQTEENNRKEEKAMTDTNNAFGFYGLDDSYGGLDRTLGLNSGAVSVNEFKKIAEKIIESDPAASKTGSYGKPMFITLEAATIGLPVDALAVVMHANVSGRHIPLLFTLLMESAEPLERRAFNMGSYTMTIASVTGDVFNDGVAAAINTYVSSAINTKENIVSAGVNVVPKTLDLKDPENEKYVRNILFFALGALNTAYDVRFGKQRFLSLVKPIGDGKFEKIPQTLHAQSVWGGRDLETAAGLPIRSDVVLQTTIRAGLKAAAGLTQNVATRPVTALSAYVDLVYAPPRVDTNGQVSYHSYGIPQNAKVVWYPRMVITRNRPMGRVINVGEMLLSLATATVLGTNYNWINAFAPKRGVEDIHDIGALGYEHEFVPGQKAKIDTQDKSFVLADFLNHTVEDNLLYSMDIEEAGDLTWMESAILACARGGEEGQEAQEFIIRAANALTGNAFSNRFKSNQKIVATEITRIHLGHYPNGDVLSDLREIDHLATLNLTGKNGTATAQKWSNALVNYRSNEAASLEEREKILLELVPNATITGYANRVTFNAAFLFALADAIADAGTTINIVEAERVARTDDRLAFSYASEFGQGANATSGLATYGYSTNSRSPRGPAAPNSGNIWYSQR